MEVAWKQQHDTFLAVLYLRAAVHNLNGMQSNFGQESRAR